ncbi:hypothetical protein AVL50_13455 [Flammeovirga sp. SJP92]|nr:hypothetical protein AVL50_13455 [Flammeovirga sp. SJP92]
MKKLIAGLVLMTLLTSCYNTRLFVGDAKPTDTLEEVNKVWTNHLLFGLVPLDNARQNPSDYLPDNQENYVIKTNTSFLNGLVSGVTFGIYSPTQTIYYIPKK